MVRSVEIPKWNIHNRSDFLHNWRAVKAKNFSKKPTARNFNILLGPHNSTCHIPSSGVTLICPNSSIQQLGNSERQLNSSLRIYSRFSTAWPIVLRVSDQGRLLLRRNRGRRLRYEDFGNTCHTCSSEDMEYACQRLFHHLLLPLQRTPGVFEDTFGIVFPFLGVCATFFRSLSLFLMISPVAGRAKTTPAVRP